VLRDLLRPAEILLHEDVGSDSDAKEALVFALLAYETWFNRPGTMAVLTGAAHSTVLGHITPGTNYAQLIRQTWK
jgi:anhydro-N-acetylmuramic acid kinase